MSRERISGAFERRQTIGQALNQLSKAAPEIAAKVPEAPRIVAFRNLLIHGYATVDHTTVWETLQSQVPALRDCVAELLDLYEQTPPST